MATQTYGTFQPLKICTKIHRKKNMQELWICGTLSHYLRKLTGIAQTKTD